jgi:hypothetical protein
MLDGEDQSGFNELFNFSLIHPPSIPDNGLIYSCSIFVKSSFDRTSTAYAKDDIVIVEQCIDAKKSLRLLLLLLVEMRQDHS